MVKDKWLLEGGQTASSSLLDRVVNSHCSFVKVNNEIKQSK